MSNVAQLKSSKLYQKFMQKKDIIPQSKARSQPPAKKKPIAVDMLD